MRIKHYTYITWATLHIAFIVLICMYAAYTKYCRFYKIKGNQSLIAAGSKVLYNNPLFVYGNCTGTGSGYGFFAPGIRSNGAIIGDCNGQKIMPHFRSYEAAIRFNSLSTSITDYIFENMADTAGKKNYSLTIAYYDLMLKSIGVHLYNTYSCNTGNMLVSYNIINFPDLSEYKKGEKEPGLITVKQMKLVLK